MTQLPLFPREAEELRGGGYPPLGDLARSTPDAFCAPYTATEPDPMGVRDWPRAVPGDPAWERWGFVLCDLPRRVRRSLRAQHRLAGDW